MKAVYGPAWGISSRSKTGIDRKGLTTLRKRFHGHQSSRASVLQALPHAGTIVLSDPLLFDVKPPYCRAMCPATPHGLAYRPDPVLLGVGTDRQFHLSRTRRVLRRISALYLMV